MQLSRSWALWLITAAAIAGFITAQQWNPSLPCFDPVARANELAKAATSPSQR